MKLKLEQIVKATEGAVQNAAPGQAVSADAHKGVRILQAVLKSLGPHTLDDLKRIAQGGGRVAPGVVLKDLVEAVDVALHTP